MEERLPAMVQAAGLPTKVLICLVLCINLASAALPSQISSPCRDRAIAFLAPYNTDSAPCSAELTQMFQQSNSQGFSEIQTKCIGRSGLLTCFRMPDPAATTGISVTDESSDCSLCSVPPSNNRTACQELLTLLASNITAEPGNCSVPGSSTMSPLESDLAVLVFLRFQLDITCVDPLPITYSGADGFTVTLKNLTQCRCGAILCPPGVFCKENSHPVWCPEGFYCPEYGGKKIKCPTGFFCPEGATEATECARGAVCEGGAARQYEFVPFFLLCLALIVAYGILLYFRRRLEIYAKLQESTANNISSESVGARSFKGSIPLQDLKSPGVADKKSSKAEIHSSLVESYGEKVTEIAEQKLTPRLRLNIEFDDIGLRHFPPTRCCGCCVAQNVPIDDDGMVTRLKSASGYLYQGTVTGVMGPSGCGKSTFLNVLCGKVESTSGEIKVNGWETSLPDFRNSIGFVPQNDIVDGSLLVEEAVMFSASIRLDKPYEERRKIVNSTLKMLGLWHVRGSIIGDAYRRGVSGGERKRVNIAIEVVAEPSALFLDEPTTGLDATASVNVIKILKNLAKTNKMTVCAVVHQPRPLIMDMLDNLILLVRGGRMVWFGDGLGAVTYFESLGYACPKDCDFPDFLSDVIAGMALRQLSDEKRLDRKSIEEIRMKKYEVDEKVRQGNINFLVKNFETIRTSEGNADGWRKKGFDIDDESERSVSICRQIFSYAYRGVLLRFVRSNRVVTDALAYLMGGIIMGIIFNEEPLLSSTINPAYGASCPTTAEEVCYRPRVVIIGRFGFYHLIALGVVVMATTTATFGGARKILFWREASSGASGLAYFLGENIVDLFMAFIYCVFYVAAVQLMVPLEGSFVLYWMLWSVAAFTIMGVAYIISIWITGLSEAMITGVILSTVMSLFNGYVPTIGDNAYWSYTMWVGRACSNIEYNLGYGLNTTIPEICKENSQLDESFNCFRDPDTDELISYYDVVVPPIQREPTLQTDFIVLVAYGVCLRLIAFVVLKTADTSKQR